VQHIAFGYGQCRCAPFSHARAGVLASFWQRSAWLPEQNRNSHSIIALRSRFVVALVRTPVASLSPVGSHAFGLGLRVAV
jgi:hypothetical protein